jgi:glycosyltransferase involved in cell wall biosynthesis
MTTTARRAAPPWDGVAEGDSPAFAYPALPGDRLRVAGSTLERFWRAFRRWREGTVGALTLREALNRRGTAPTLPRLESTTAPVVMLPAVAWGYRFQRPQQLARAFAAAGRPVLYCEPFGRTSIQPQQRLVRQGPVHRLELAVPGRPDPYRELPSAEVAAALATRIAAGIRRRPQLLVAQLPFWGEVALRLRELVAAPLVYDRLDLHSGFAGVSAAVHDAELRVMARADGVVASSATLLDADARRAPRAFEVPNAVWPEDFATSTRSPPARVTLCYVGALSHWFDAEQVARLAAGRPAWRLRLAGRVESSGIAALGGLPNVELLGEVPYAAVPALLAGASALLVPFRDLPLTRAVDPVKAYEGMAAGVPVVSLRLPALERWREPLVYLYDGDGLLAAVERALAADGPAATRERRERAAVETWRRRAEAILAAAA